MRRSAARIGRLNAEIKQRTALLGILPNEPALTRQADALLPEQNRQ